MSPELAKLIWMFPIAFMLHDFEELLFFEPWLKKNAGPILARLHHKVPALIEKRIETITHKNTLQFAVPICLIFLLTCVAALLAAESGQYTFFLLASSLFFLHGFMHLGQAIMLRRYVPAVITTALVALPYGAILFSKLLEAGIVDIPGLLIYFGTAVVLGAPFILGMHAVGEFTYGRIMDLFGE